MNVVCVIKARSFLIMERELAQVRTLVGRYYQLHLELFTLNFLINVACMITLLKNVFYANQMLSCIHLECALCDN